MSAKSPQGPDNTTRNLVIGMVAFVVAIGAIFSVVSNRENTSAALPSSVSKADGYGIVFNGDLTGVPVIDIWEDFQCPVCVLALNRLMAITWKKSLKKRKQK